MGNMFSASSRRPQENLYLLNGISTPALRKATLREEPAGNFWAWTP
jgi:hypothetical protein